MYLNYSYVIIEKQDSLSYLFLKIYTNQPLLSLYQMGYAVVNSEKEDDYMLCLIYWPMLSGRICINGCETNAFSRLALYVMFWDGMMAISHYMRNQTVWLRYFMDVNNIHTCRGSIVQLSIYRLQKFIWIRTETDNIYQQINFNI